MTVEVKINENLRYYAKSFRPVEGGGVEVPEGTTVGELLEILCFPQEISVIVIINGTAAHRGKVLKSKDMLQIIAPMSGG